VLPLLGPLNGTSLAYPCFASPTLLPLAAGVSSVTLSAGNQVPAIARLTTVDPRFLVFQSRSCLTVFVYQPVNCMLSA